MLENYDAVRKWCHSKKPSCAMVLGSGLDFTPAGVDCRTIEIPYQIIPGMGGNALVEGHAGCLRLIELRDEACVAFAGRRHLYEGIPFSEAVSPVNLVKDFCISNLVITSSAGGLDPGLNPGDVVLLDDFIIPFDTGIPGDFKFEESETGESTDAGLAERMRYAAEKEGIEMKSGVYAYMPGPAFETNAETDMLRRLGAGLVGMSTAPEWWAALRAGLKVAAVSLVANVHKKGALPPSHQEVLERAGIEGGKMERLLWRFVFG